MVACRNKWTDFLRACFYICKTTLLFSYFQQFLKVIDELSVQHSMRQMEIVVREERMSY